MMAAKNNLGLLQLGSGDDPKKSIDLVSDAANAGYSPAQVSMGQLFLDGLPAAGITKDADQARENDSMWRCGLKTLRENWYASWHSGRITSATMPSYRRFSKLPEANPAEHPEDAAHSPDADKVR